MIRSRPRLPLLLASFAPFLLALVASMAPSHVARADEKKPVFVPPKLERFVEATTPESLEVRSPVEVMLSIELDDKGVPTKVAVTTSAGGDDAAAYDVAAVAAARDFRFTPGTADGKPVPVRVAYRYRFVMKPPPPPPREPKPEEAVALPALPTVPFSGQVRRSGDRATISAVIVTPDVPELEAITDDQGRFSFAAIPVGKHVFKLSSGEIAASEVKVELKQGKRLEVTWYVAAKERYTSTVRGKRIVQETTEYVLSADEVKRIPGTQGDTLKAVQNLPGVARSAFGGGQIAVWGSSPGDTRTYVNGVQIPVLFHFGGLRSTVNSEIIENLRFLPGGYSADYGRGTGGVIEIETKRPRIDGIHGFVQLDLIDGSLMLEGKIAKNLSFSVGARRSWIDALLPIFTTSDFQLSPVYYDYQARLSWRATPHDDLDVVIFGSDDVVNIQLKQPDPALSAVFNSHTFYHRILAKYTHRFAGRATLTITPSFGYDVPISVTANFGNIPVSIDARQTSYNLRAVARVPITDWLRVDAGLDFEGHRWDVSAFAPSTGMPREGDTRGPGISSFTAVDTTFYTHAIAPYALAEFSLWKNRIVISPQLRLETYHFSNYQHGTEYAHTYVRAEPRLQMRFNVHPKVSLKLAIGAYDQLPDPITLTPGYGSPGINPIFGVHYVAGVEAKPLPGLFIQAQVFYKDLSNLIVRGQTSLDPLYTNNGRGRAYGADFLLRQELWKGLFGWISYTVSRSERKDGPDQPWRVFSLDQTHIFTLIASYKLPRGYQVGLRFRVVSGNPFTPVRTAYFDNNDGNYTAVSGDRYSSRLSTFHQLDLRFDKAWTFNRWKLSVYLDIQNLYYAKNPEGITYNYNYTQTQPITGLPFLPVLGLRGDF